jgi:hypothetical protein
MSLANFFFILQMKWLIILALCIPAVTNAQMHFDTVWTLDYDENLDLQTYRSFVEVDGEINFAIYDSIATFTVTHSDTTYEPWVITVTGSAELDDYIVYYTKHGECKIMVFDNYDTKVLYDYSPTKEIYLRGIHYIAKRE